MSSRSRTRSIALTAVFAAAVSGAACADDNSMSILTGESYADFNGGENFPFGAPHFDTAKSTFPQTNPHGVPDRELAALSSIDPVWKIPNPSAARALAESDVATAWRASHPGGFTAREYEAIAASSSGVVWKLTPADVQAIAAENEAAVAKLEGKEPLNEKVARLFQGHWLASTK